MRTWFSNFGAKKKKNENSFKKGIPNFFVKRADKRLQQQRNWYYSGYNKHAFGKKRCFGKEKVPL